MYWNGILVWTLRNLHTIKSFLAWQDGITIKSDWSKIQFLTYRDLIFQGPRTKCQCNCLEKKWMIIQMAEYTFILFTLENKIIKLTYISLKYAYNTIQLLALIDSGPD